MSFYYKEEHIEYKTYSAKNKRISIQDHILSLQATFNSLKTNKETSNLTLGNNLGKE